MLCSTKTKEQTGQVPELVISYDIKLRNVPYAAVCTGHTQGKLSDTTLQNTTLTCKFKAVALHVFVTLYNNA